MLRQNSSRCRPSFSTKRSSKRLLFELGAGASELASFVALQVAGSSLATPMPVEEAPLVEPRRVNDYAAA